MNKMNRILYGMGMILFIPLYAMDVQQIKVEKLETILAKLHRNEQEYLRLKYISLAKAYAAEATEALRLYMIEFYDSADATARKIYDGILQDKLKKGMNALRQESAPFVEGESFAEDTNRWLEKIRVDALVRMIEQYSEDKNQEILRMYTGLTCQDYKKRAQVHVERLHRSNSHLSKVIALIESTNPSAAAIVQEIKRLRAEQKDPLNGASFMVTALLGLSEKELESKRLGGSLTVSSPAVQKASGTQIFVNSKERGRGGIVFSPQEAQYSRWIRKQFEEGRGASSADAIGAPLTRDELQKIRDYIKLIIGGIEGFDYEVLDQLSLEELATVMRQASELQIDVLLDLVERKFVERIKERDARYFEATWGLLKTFDFSPEIQKVLSHLFFTGDQHNKLLSLLHTRLQELTSKTVLKPGPMGYFMAIKGSAVELWHASTHKRLWEKTYDTPVVTAAWLQAPFLLVCTEKEAHVLDVISNRCLKTVTVQECGGSGSFWACAPSLDQTTFALGCGDAIVFVNLRTGEFVMNKLNRATGNYYLTPDARFTVFPHHVLHKKNVLVRAITAKGNTMWFWDAHGSQISTIDLTDSIIGIDPKGQHAILGLKNGCSLLDLSSEQSLTIINDGSYSKAVFSHDGKLGVFLREDGVLEMRDASDWQIKTTISAQASDFFLSSDNQHIITLHDNELRIWHYFDDRLSYLHIPIEMANAFLFAHCTDVLKEDSKCISKVESYLLEGSEKGIRALTQLALGEDGEDAGEVVKIGVYPAPVPIENVAFAEQVYAQALEHLNALRYKEAVVCLKAAIAFPHSEKIRCDAYLKLGELYKEGKGVEKSAEIAFAYFSKAV